MIARPPTPAERGRQGGLATLARHGNGHFAAIGRRGFAGLARKLGGRKGALGLLCRRGKLPGPPDLADDQLHALEALVGLERPPSTERAPTVD